MLKYILILLFSLLIAGYYNYRSHPEIPVSRRWLLFGLRFVSLSILLILLLSSILYWTQHKKLASSVLVLEDNSGSMELKHGDATKAAQLNPLQYTLASSFEKAGYKLIEHSYANGLDGDKSNSLLAKAIIDFTTTDNAPKLDAVIISTDGWWRDESLEAVKQLGCPFYVLADSSKITVPDIAVSSVRSNRYAYRGEPNTIRAEFTSLAYNGPAEAKLFIGGNPVSRQSIKLEAGKSTALDFTHRFNKEGFYTWKVELSPLNKETRTGNNSYPGAIEVLSDKQRIMLVSDKPAWDNKVTLDAITTNPRWQAISYLNRDGRLYSGETPASKLSAENLAAIIVVNNGTLRLDAASASFVNGAVNSGCGLLFMGLPVSELAASLPMQRSNIATSYQGFVNPTPAATAYPMLSSLTTMGKDIPPLDYYYVSASPGAEILATMNNPQSSPAITAKSSGGGRSLAFATLNLWRWQMQGGDEGYNKLITNSLTWLSNKSTSSYSAIYNSSYFLGEEIRIRLRSEDDIRQSSLDANPRIRIMNKEGKEVHSDYLTREGEEYSFSTQLTEPGTYSFVIEDKGKSTKGRFELSDSSIESRDFGYNLPLLAWLASETNGKLIYASTIDSFKPLPAVSEEQISRREVALYKKWYVLSLFILAFCVELYLRRRWGLL
jgi:hypothetical protein